MMCEKCSGILKVADRRIKAMEELLACYRTGGRPTEKLLNELHLARVKWDKIEIEMEVGE